MLDVMSTPEQIAEAYSTAWVAGDFDTLRGLLADDVDFVGAMAAAHGADDVLDGLRALGRVLTRIEVLARLADDADVITWFNLHTSVAPPAETANWTHVENGRITRIKVTFDPRKLLAGLEQRTSG